MAVRVHRISASGTAAAPANVRVYRVSATGAAQPVLVTSKTVYEAGETVAASPINGSAPHTYTVAPTIPFTVDSNGVLKFTAPALVDPKVYTIGYKAASFTSVTIHEASVLLGQTGIPCTVYVNAPDVVVDTPIVVDSPARGINLSGAEFSANDPTKLPGTVNVDYMYPTAADFTYLASRGHKVARLPIRWERVQPTLSSALDAAQVTMITDTLDRAAAVGMKVIVDVHNYGRYTNAADTELVLGGGTLTNTHLTDLWTRLSTALKGHRALHAYGLMNEPHDLTGGATAWQTSSQACVTAIRNNADPATILVPGYSWSGAQSWVGNHPTPWITDPAGATVYEAHYYFDRDNSGDYPDTFAAETADAVSRGFASLTDRAVTELSRFTDWCTSNNVQGFIGEIGWTNTSTAASWNAVGEALYDVLDNAGIGATYWAAGQWYGIGYNLSAYTGSPLAATNAQATIIEAHPSGSAPGAVGYPATYTGTYTPAYVAPGGGGAPPTANVFNDPYADTY